MLTSAYGEAFFHRRQRLSEQRTFDAYARLLQQQVTGLPLGVAV